MYCISQLQKESRPGVQKIGIVLTDGKSTEPEKTEKEAKQVREAGVEVFVIGMLISVPLQKQAYSNILKILPPKH